MLVHMYGAGSVLARPCAVSTSWHVRNLLISLIHRAFILGKKNKIMLSSVYQTFRQKQLFLFQTSHCVSPQPRTLPSSPHYLCDEYLLACHSVVSELKTTHSSTHNSSRALILRRGMGGSVTSCNFFTKIWEVVLFESVSPH